MLWNALPFNVKCAKSVDVLKVKLKHPFLVQHFYHHNLVSTLFRILVCNILSTQTLLNLNYYFYLFKFCEKFFGRILFSQSIAH